MNGRDGCQGLLPLVGIIDLGQAVISSDEKAINGAKSKLLKRVLYAVAVFLVVWLVGIVMGLVADAGSDTSLWKTCWKAVTSAS